jgi:hypothetical protein
MNDFDINGKMPFKPGQLVRLVCFPNDGAFLVIRCIVQHYEGWANNPPRSAWMIEVLSQQTGNVTERMAQAFQPIEGNDDIS